VESFGGAFRGRALPISSAVANDFTFVWILRTNGESDSAACRELRGHDCLPRRACFHEIVQDVVGYRFIESALIPIRSEIELKRLAFNTESIGDIVDIDPGKVRLSGDWTNRSEIVRFEMNVIVSPGRRIWKGLEPRLGRRAGQSYLAPSEERQLTSTFYFCHGDTKVRPKAIEVNRPYLGKPGARPPHPDILLPALQRRRFRRQLVLPLAIRCSRRETSGDPQ